MPDLDRISEKVHATSSRTPLPGQKPSCRCGQGAALRSDRTRLFATPGQSLELLLSPLPVLDINTRSMPLENSSISSAHREFMVQHPAIFAISPPHPCRSLEALSSSDRISPFLHKSFEIFRMNTGSPFPSQQPLQRLPDEIQPGPIEEVEISVRSRGVDQRRRRVDDLTKTQALIIVGTVLVGSHGAHGTTPRNYSALFSMGFHARVATDLLPLADNLLRSRWSEVLVRAIRSSGLDGNADRSTSPIATEWCGGDINRIGRRSGHWACCTFVHQWDWRPAPTYKEYVMYSATRNCYYRAVRG